MLALRARRQHLNQKLVSILCQVAKRKPTKFKSLVHLRWIDNSYQYVLTVCQIWEEFIFHSVQSKDVGKCVNQVIHKVGVEEHKLDIHTPFCSITIIVEVNSTGNSEMSSREPASQVAQVAWQLQYDFTVYQIRK